MSLQSVSKVSKREKDPIDPEGRRVRFATDTRGRRIQSGRDLVHKSERVPVWKKALAPDDFETLQALRHVRHSVAHGLKYARSDGLRNEFNAHQKRLDSLVAHADRDTLRLNSTAGHHAVGVLMS